MEAFGILARLQPIERAIMQTPVYTITGLGVKARHAAYVMSKYWEAPADQIDCDEQVVRLLIEAICKLATCHCQAAKLSRKPRHNVSLFPHGSSSPARGGRPLYP
jgi:hypothetical protein